MITLHQFEISPFCDKVRRILHWKRQPYVVNEIPPSAALFRARRLSPAGKLPCIEHDGRLISDSTDIAHYLEARFPEPALLPPGPRDRALVHVLEDWADESLYFYEMRLRFTVPHNARRWAPELVRHDAPMFRKLGPLLLPLVLKRQTAAQGVGRRPLAVVEADVARHVEAIDGLLAGGEWLVTDSLTLADIAVFAQLFCIRGAAEGARLVQARPAVVAWMDRVDAATRAPAAAPPSLPASGRPS